ncbi:MULTISPECIES: hypothetical protein [unclassified Streptomyces]|uniref:hypothetical protein n=1 Tax=unclassified Streptomyces TaxID=2593676 RepID=UPI001E3AC216|nr:hypothetical protein [Streptomyces sp. CB02980]MCB8908353.1 hypothetical protein [Streptomyces sp. CB02980]
METDEPVLGDYPDVDEPRLPLLTATEARDTVGYMRLLETLDLTPRGQAAGQLAANLARRLPTD